MKLLAVAAGLVVLALTAVAFQQDLERARARWKDLPEERRREIVERYERWKSLPEDERARLRERFEQVDPMRRNAHACLPEKARREFSRLGPQAQADVLAGVATQQIRERGRELLDRLPPHWRDALEKSTPEERTRLLEEFRERMHGMALKRIDQLAGEGALAAADAERLRQASPEELARGLFEIESRRFRERLEREGPPSYVTPEQWAEWKNLPPHEQWMKLHEAKRGCEPRGHEFGDPRRGGERGERGRDDKPQSPLARRLRDAMRADPEWFVELAGKSFEERAELFGSRLRERVLTALDSEPSGLDAATLEGLRKLEGREFFEALGRAVPDLGRPWWSHDGERRGERGPERGNSRKGEPRGGPPPGPPPAETPRG